MKYKIVLLLNVLLVVSFSSCKKKNEVMDLIVSSYNYSLVRTDKKLVYAIDSNTEYERPALFTFTSKNGKRYLTFQNKSFSEILFYELNSGNCIFRLKIEEEGPNGVPRFLGYHIKDFDEIYLTSYGIPQITRVDTTGRILQKINYGKTDEGVELVAHFKSAINTYTPLIIIGDKFFFTQSPMPGEPIETGPVSGYIDTAKHSVQTLPLTFPPIIKKEEFYTAGIGTELNFSRCFDGYHFVYAFNFEEAITVVSIDHKEIKKIPAKSKYIKKINNPHEKRPADMVLGAKRMCEAAFYWNLLYDKYRNVYYRVAYPETEMEAGENYIEIWKSGRKRFSIIILDENFNIIGETLFPDYTYMSKVMFVEEEGLYICDSHYKNPNFDENILSFQCFELVKK
jgi:hypothetical protein